MLLTVNNFNKKLISLVLLSQLGFCASGQSHVVTSDNQKSSIVKNKFSKEMENYFLQEPVEDEAFRVFVSSDEYSLKQIGFTESMTIVTDDSGRNPMAEEINAYDMIDIFTEAVYKVELFKDSGLIWRIRPVSPANVSEINKIIADDITRLKFSFKDKDKIEPLTFKIRYGVRLQKKKSKEEIKKILQENVRE